MTTKAQDQKGYHIRQTVRSRMTLRRHSSAKGLVTKRTQTTGNKMPKATTSRRLDSLCARRAPTGAIQVLVRKNSTKPRSEI